MATKKSDLEQFKDKELEKELRKRALKAAASGQIKNELRERAAIKRDPIIEISD